MKNQIIYNPILELGDMPKFGVMFKMDTDYNQLLESVNSKWV